jgi:short-subunit dehydrogenase
LHALRDMKTTFKNINEQAIVITGASSGIGLATAEMAAARGACVVLAARSESELNSIVERINSRGGRAIAVECDVKNPDDVERVAEQAVQAFGRIDTWVNNAGVGMYGRLVEQSIADKRELFDVDFWGVVYGCRSAVRRMEQSGGTIINVGSQVSLRAAPLLGMYSAAKHAVRGYTDALRMELEHDRIPIWVTLVMPGPIDTPFPQHGANVMEHEPKHVPPVYPPEEVAQTILTCAQKPVREIMVGGVPWLQSVMSTVAPRLTDLQMERQMWNGMQTDGPPDSPDSLSRPSGEDYGRRHGRQPGWSSSMYTRAALSDLGRAIPFVALGLVIAGLAGVRR